MNKVIIIYGPTASGKTNIALDLALKIGGELVSFDSRQIYKDLKIGTNVGDVKEFRNSEIESFYKQINDFKLIPYTLNNVPIHLVNFLDQNIQLNVFLFRKLAEKIVDSIIQRGKVPIVVGGTGLYIDAFIYNYNNSNDTKSEKREYFSALSIEELWAKINQIDSKALKALNSSDVKNKVRLVRLLEKLESGNSIESEKVPNKKYTFQFIKPEFTKEDLKIRIEGRVDEMFSQGLIEETEKSLKQFGSSSVALKGIGYRDVVRYLNSEIDLKECINLVKTAHLQYAKRQITWFNKYLH